MSPRIAFVLLAFAFLCCSSTPLWGAFSSDDSNILPVPDIADFATFGEDMVGMDVTVTFAGGATDTATWGLDAGPGGLALGANNWMLENRNTNGDHTFQSPWTLTYTGGFGNITNVTLSGFAAFFKGTPVDEAVGFDRDRFDSGVPIPLPGTLGSQQGKNLQTSSFIVDVHYRDPVDSLADGAGIIRDLYGSLDITIKDRIVPKWQQLPEQQVGENVHSDIDWRASQLTIDSQAVADDFISDGRPIIGVRWWGSYFDPNDQPKQDPNTGGFVPQEEEGFLLTFFNDSDAGPIPDGIAGAYIAPVENVVVEPTPLVGLDNHPVWQYEVRLEDTFLDHPGPLATDESFNEEQGVEYWLSVAAESGHRIDPVTGEETDTGEDFDTREFWGWHTTPLSGSGAPFVDNLPVASDITMPTGTDEWQYVQWRQLDFVHEGRNMAFELLTSDSGGFGSGEFVFRQDADNPENIPEPGGALLALIALAGLAQWTRRRKA